MFSSLNVKVGSALIMCVILAGVYLKAVSIYQLNIKNSHTAGYKAAESKYLKEKLEALENLRIANEKAKNKAVAAISEELSIVESEKVEWLSKALELKKINRSLERERISEIAKVDTCTNRGPDYVELWNDRARMFREYSDIISE